MLSMSRSPVGALAWVAPLLCLIGSLSGATGCRERPDATAKEAEQAPAVRRVVTLTPSATELVAALDATDLLVGVDSYSTYPAEVYELPKVGDFLRPNFEVIVTLAPDLVIADAVQGEVSEGLAAAGVKTLSLSMHTIDDVRTGLTKTGAALGREAAAAAAIASIDAAIASVAEKARARAPDSPRPRVLAVVDREHGGLGNLVAAGPGSYLDQLLGFVGADNALAGYQVRYPKLSAEQLLRAQPTVILDVVPGEAAARAGADWERLPELPAVAAGRVHVLQESFFMSPGPRVDVALPRLSALLYPQ